MKNHFVLADVKSRNVSYEKQNSNELTGTV